MIVAPEVMHADLRTACNATTYNRRMWCRAENLCHSLRNGIGQMWLVQGVHMGDCIKLTESHDPVIENFMSSNLRVMQGEATCEADKAFLVLPILGLYAEVYAHHLVKERERAEERAKERERTMAAAGIAKQKHHPVRADAAPTTTDAADTTCNPESQPHHAAVVISTSRSPRSCPPRDDGDPMAVTTTVLTNTISGGQSVLTNTISANGYNRARMGDGAVDARGDDEEAADTAIVATSMAEVDMRVAASVAAGTAVGAAVGAAVGGASEGAEATGSARKRRVAHNLASATVHGIHKIHEMMTHTHANVQFVHDHEASIFLAKSSRWQKKPHPNQPCAPTNHARISLSSRLGCGGSSFCGTCFFSERILVSPAPHPLPPFPALSLSLPTSPHLTPPHPPHPTSPHALHLSTPLIPSGRRKPA